MNWSVEMPDAHAIFQDFTSTFGTSSDDAIVDSVFDDASSGAGIGHLPYSIDIE